MIDRERVIDAYLNEMSWAMGGSLAEQQAARDELRAHIDDAARASELQGAGAEDALRTALVELGDPSALGRAMQSSCGAGALRRPLVQPLGALVLERHRERHLPSPRLAIALMLSVFAIMIVALAYAWPG